MGRIVIAGASGLTGLALTRLLGASHEVFAIARRPRPPGLPESVRWIEGDIGKGVPAGMPERYDGIYALFQSPDFRNFPDAAPSVFQTNVGGVQALLDHARRAGARRFVFTSTGGLYAPKATDLVETDPVTTAGGLAYYLATKRCAELLVETYAKEFSTLIVRPFFIYGPRQSNDMLVPRLRDSVSGGRAIKLQGRDGLAINPVHVDDAARLLGEALSASVEGVLNLAGPQVVTLRQIGVRLGAVLGCEPVFEADEAAAPPRVVASLERLGQTLGMPRIGFDEGATGLVQASGIV